MKSTRKSLRGYQLAGFLGMFLTVGSIVAWATLTSIQGAVIASGTTRVESTSKKIQHREGGIVKKINVRDGDTVKAGTLLIVLDDTDARAQMDIVDSVLVENLAKRARLWAERDGAKALKFPDELEKRKKEPGVAAVMKGQLRLFKTQLAASKDRKDQLTQRIAQLNDEIKGLKAQLAARQKQAKLINRERSSLAKLLKKGLVSKSRVLALSREQAKLQGETGRLTSEIAKTRGRISETRLQIIQLGNDDRTKTLSALRDTETKIAEYLERRRTVRAVLARTRLRAPRAGIVHQLNIHTIGGIISPGETVMLIVPSLDEIIIEARVRPDDIDQISIGQAATMRFPAFDARKTPQVTAKIIQIAPDATQPNDNTPPYFAVRLKLAKDQIARLGDNKLVPGMPAEAFIQTRSRTPMSYLLQPLTDQIMHTFREN